MSAPAASWIQLHVSVFSHPKTRRLAKRLGVSPYHAVGNLAALWAFTMEFAPDGDLSRFNGEEIEVGCGWDGADGAFIDAAVAVGYLDETDGRLSIHDWDDHGGKLARQRANERRRSAERRSAARKTPAGRPSTDTRPADDRRSQSGRPVDDRRTTAGRGEERREEEKRREKKNIAAPQNTARVPRPVDNSAAEALSAPDATISAAPAPEVERPDDTHRIGAAPEVERPDDTAYSEEFEAFWAAYPRKEEKRRAWRAWRTRLRQRASPDAMTTAARHYATGCQGTDRRFIKQAATFLGPDMPFMDWVSGVPPGCAATSGRGLSAAEMWGELIAETAEVET